MSDFTSPCAANLSPPANDAIAQAGALEALARSLCTRFPRRVLGWKTLGELLRHRGRYDESVSCLQQAATLAPDDAGVHNSLALALHALGQYAQAEASLHRALALVPDFIHAHNNLAAVLKGQGRLEQAEQSLRQALLLAPDFPLGHYNLGSLLHQRGQLSLSEQSFCRALALDPTDAASHNNLGVTLQDMGHLAEAGNSYRQALDITPDFPEAHSNLLFLMNSSVTSRRSACLAEARRFGLRQQQKASAPFAEWRCDPRPGRLRVGLVSGDFNVHSVGHFLAGWLGHVDPALIDLVAYATSALTDVLTARITPYFSIWRSLVGLDDDAAARLVEADGVHVLVDLSGHTRHNRLPVFAWRAAPVQVSWLGYFATTGMVEIDYVLADPVVAPVADAGHFVERLWHLPESYLCFSAPDVALEVAPLPMLAAGHVTFGCFNNLTKMNDAVVARWAAILRAVSGAILFLKTRQLDDAGVLADTVQRFVRHGIDARRLRLEGVSPRAELLAAYQQVDIALDPSPYPGGTTSVESLWMGVPVLTLGGDCFLSRVGASIARNAGLHDWIAADADDYFSKAVFFASRPEWLAGLRTGLRQQVMDSPLFDAARFARHVEAAFWGMWHNRQSQP